jgi:hypothetical protein
MAIDKLTYKFLSYLFKEASGYIELRGIKQGRVFYRNFVPVNKISTLSLPGVNDIFFGVCTRKDKQGTKEFIQDVVALWVDIDSTDGLSGLDRVLTPTLIVKSGKGYHFYWKLSNPVKANNNIELILKGLSTVLNGDSAATDLTRMLRLPGTYNTKYTPPVKVEIVASNHLLYNLEDFERYKQHLPVYDNNYSKNRKRFLYPYNLVNIIIDNCNFIKWASTYQNDVKEPLWWAMITNLVCFKDSAQLIHQFSCRYYRYSYRETEYKINHALKMAPLTCLYIFRNGYQGCLKCSFWGKIIAPVSLVSQFKHYGK